ADRDGLAATHSPQPSLRAERSNPERQARLDCFVASLLAMTMRYNFAFSRHLCARVLQKTSAQKNEGVGNAGCPPHPQPVCKGRKHTVVTTVAPEHPAFPHAMVLTAYAALSPATNSSCHRHRRISDSSKARLGS